MKASFTSYVFGILFTGALAFSTGCIAQAGTDEASQGEGLTADQEQPTQVQQQQPATMKQRMQNAPGVVTHPVMHATGLPQEQLEGLEGTDPGETVQDDGDGKEPDPHPWHTNKATLASH
ncbi:MAG TPA: hypothetical protein VGH87_25120 [Polyangiaceae bacterium]|jgi:hypothetical protein|nr:hypothetical protein [Polyangiaceae bacterium]